MIHRSLQKGFWQSGIGRRWVLAKVRDFADWLPPGCSLLDIGAGNAALSFQLKNRGIRTESLDLSEQSLFEEIPITTYNGIRMPYTDRQFDFALLYSVLHHTKEPAAVIAEAARVAERIIINEDVYRNPLQQYLTYLADTLVNAGFSPMTYQNRNDTGWRELFRQCGLKVTDFRERRVLLFFRQATYLLERD